jgi:hypothetical protein
MGRWENLLRVKAGDPVLHLRDDARGHGFFVGYSLAEQDGYETTERPPLPGEWGYSPSFYRVPLASYALFPQPLDMDAVFDAHDAELRAYIERNRSRPRGQRRTLFCVIQGGRLQRQNGGYLSEVDDELDELLFGITQDYPGVDVSVRDEVTTGERIQQLKARIGQQRFSEEVRANYGHACCFPGCPITDDNFLVGSHIARWADVPELRGRLDNGLCLCLMHDKAFELGLFTVDADLCIAMNPATVGRKESSWGKTNLPAVQGQPIRLCSETVAPTREALEHHWARVRVPE